MHKRKVLFVCMGNICRSPTAQGIMEAKLQQRGLADAFEVDSAGTHSREYGHSGNPPDPRTIAAAHQHGIVLAHQRSRQFYQADYDYYDDILVMDTGNQFYAEQIAGENDGRIRQLLSFCESGLSAAGVGDPYMIGGFGQIYQVIERGVEAYLQYLGC